MHISEKTDKLQFNNKLQNPLLFAGDFFIIVPGDVMALLLRNVNAVVTCDENDTVYEGVDIFVKDSKIEAIGKDLDVGAERVINCTNMLCYPGLINTHHHLYQQFSRNIPKVQNMELFPWLKALYGVWKNIDDEVVYLSSLSGMAELMKNGCTTCFDHHYVFPQGRSDTLLDSQFLAADVLGIRMYASRGSMNLSEKDGGLPPDSVVQTTDEILSDSIKAIEKYQDSSFGSMRMVALAPCSPFSADSDLYRESAKLARQYGVRLHTHLCETIDEENYTLSAFSKRPLEYMQSLGFVGDDVWYAHGIHFNDEELKMLADTKTGVAHCPVSNMKLSSGVAKISQMLSMGVRVGLAVDGSASNDGSNMLEEMRVAYLLSRLTFGSDGLTPYQVLKLATAGSASVLGRNDIGVIECGRCADMFLVDKRRVELVGASFDPKSMLSTIGLKGAVDYTIVGGEITVENGRLKNLDEDKLSEKANKKVEEYLSDIL